MMQQARRWLPGRRLVLVVDGGFAAVSLALRLSQSDPIPVLATAWYHKVEPTFADCLALVRRHLWRARYLVNSTPEAECWQFPQEVLDLLSHGVPLAA
jgi:hypothetical protein